MLLPVVTLMDVDVDVTVATVEIVVAAAGEVEEMALDIVKGSSPPLVLTRPRA